ncbi:hypothetical protein RB614_00820 [Phytohabitans sp. ZYX-F-186]|uniref:HEPN AbiU2-like domain-containing protein n=1 Tax=Phytohabitans maris TaxID=3071409 RepID=A0ABU0Z9R1_9ACTN|nr:hypothetical protein [Phytohabitans sp. ZYX-F-186]MDQ7903062.1 hypothetical protein [Phytohabitans sp. ZYX-F-186]
MEKEFEDLLRAKLSPEAVTLTLTRAGCFLSAYELIKSEVVEKVHQFFWRGFQDGQHVYDEERYRQTVLFRSPKSKYRASCAWLVEMGALTAEQVATLEQIQEHRQEIAHELPKLLIDPTFDVRADLLVAAVEIVRKLGVFWGSIEVDTSAEWDGKEVDYEGIKSGSYLLMDYLLVIAELSPDADKQAEPVP